MSDDFVSYEQAVKLKAAGFNEPSHYGYSVKMRLEPELSFGNPKMVHSKALKNYNDNRKGNEKGLEFCSAVPLWQAQKWLREEMGIDLIVSPKFDSKTGYRIGYFWRWAQRADIIDTKTYSTYESALSVGLDAALKLIEKKGE